MQNYTISINTAKSLMSCTKTFLNYKKKYIYIITACSD